MNSFTRVNSTQSDLDANPQQQYLSSTLCGLPVITTRGCGNSKYIEDYVNGIVAAQANSQELKVAIDWFIKNPARIGGTFQKCQIQSTVRKF
jgi:glycosyltransferase involved in cell wall biosynthesis